MVVRDENPDFCCFHERGMAPMKKGGNLPA
jgi:hypothetical protein